MPDLLPGTVPLPMVRYAITDRTRFPGDEQARQDELVRHVSDWAGNGPDFIQLREKELPAGVLANLVRRMLIALRAASRAPKLLINSRADVAIATGADGVHLTSAEGSLTPAQVRQLYDSAGLPDPVISVSCHTLAEVSRAHDSGASLILFGPVFEKSIRDEVVAEGTGLNLLHLACAAATPTPVLALGGITKSNAAACLAAGAAGIAAIRLFQGEPRA